MTKLLIGLGCSWTQGEGGYPDEIWKQYNGRMNLRMDESMHLIPIEHENSWVNVLCRDYLKEYTPINLGQRGVGNRGSAKSLHLTNIDWDKVEDAIVVFMLTGFERFDFFRVDFNDTTFCGKSDIKPCGHYNFQTVWPHLDASKLWEIYAREVFSDRQMAGEQFCNIMDVQQFCKTYDFKFVFANAFDTRGKDFFYKKCGELADRIDWTAHLHTTTTYKSFMDLLVEKDGVIKEGDHLYNKYKNFAWPQKYLTNDIHPTIEGYKVIADELYKFITSRYNLT